MKKSIKLLIIVLILLFIGYKVYLLNKYNVEKRYIDTSEIFKEDMFINSKEYKDNLFTFDNISFRNDFKDYTKNEHNWYIKKDSDDNVIGALYITQIDQYHNLLTDGNLKVINGDNDKVVNKLFVEEDKLAFLEEYNINDDVDLMNYIKDNYYLKNNILTSSKKMKQNYIINSFVNIALPTFSKITLIKGDVNGYILYTNENIRQIHLLSGDYQYIMSLVGKKLVTDEYITSLLETVKIK